MSEYISKQEAIKIADSYMSEDAMDIREEITLLPTADVRENVHGEWRRDFDGNEFYWYCTHCKTEYYEEDLLMGGNVLPRFCPICGCDMRKGETNG